MPNFFQGVVRLSGARLSNVAVDTLYSAVLIETLRVVAFG